MSNELADRVKKLLEKCTPGEWYAKRYESDGAIVTWGVRQATVLGFAICSIVAQDMEDVENGEERANAELLALVKDLARAYLAQQDSVLIGEIETAKKLVTDLTTECNRQAAEIDKLETAVDYLKSDVVVGTELLQKATARVRGLDYWLRRMIGMLQDAGDCNCKGGYVCAKCEVIQNAQAALRKDGDDE